MAQLRHIGRLLQGLVNAQIPDPSNLDVEAITLSCLQTLEDAKYERINEFDIHARLQGLVEKCRILNKDPLADALHTRLEELSAVSNEWTPEVLFLLLSLSNRPVENSRVEDLELLQPEAPPVPLTWAAIIADDPLEDQTLLWRDAEFGGDDTDDDGGIEFEQSDDVQSEPDSSSSHPEDVDTSLSGLIYHVDDQALNAVSEARHRPILALKSGGPRSSSERKCEAKTSFTELYLFREVISMLLGLPTAVFTETETGNLAILPQFTLTHLSQGSIEHMMSAFVKLGVHMRKIRQAVKNKEIIPLVQTFQTALAVRLRDVDAIFYEIQRKLLDDSCPLTLSLLDLQVETCKATGLVQQLYAILIDLEMVPANQRAFRILEMLFERTCALQSVGDAEGYKNMADIFFECFQTYLRPIRNWMEKGELSHRDHVFFVRRSDKEVSNECLWRDQYHLVYGDGGSLYAPGFLHLAARKIFNTGKSVDLLKCLGYPEERLSTDTDNEPAMSFGSVCNATDPDMLSPFSELFDIALDGWIVSNHQLSASLLLNQFESQCGLERSLDALEYIYFHRNGAVTSGFIAQIFERLDRGKPGWNDSLVITDLLHETFASVQSIDIKRLGLQHAKQPHKDRTIFQRSMSAIEDLKIIYGLAWPIANIIRPEAMETHQRVFILLTQLQRAKYLLEKRKLPRATTLGSKYLHLIYRLHANLLWFTNTLFTHMTGMILSVNTTKMREDMSRAKDVDGMVSVHEKFIHQLKDQFLLSKQHSSLHQAIVSILDLTIVYSKILMEEAGIASQSKHNPKNRKSRRFISSDESDGDELDKDKGGEASASSQLKSTHVEAESTSGFEKLVNAQRTYAQLLSFIAASVRSVSKAKGDTLWEVLAGSLAQNL